MLLPEPDLISYNKADKTVTMEFSEDQSLNGEYQVRGSVCWPILDVKTGVMTGAFLVAGRRCDDNVVYIFKSTSFTNVDPIQDVGGKILYDGCARWLSHMWTRFCAYRYFWHQAFVIHARWRREVHSSAMIRPKPTFIEVECDNVNLIQSIIWEKLHAGRLVYGTDIKEAVDVYQVNPEAEIPEVLALQTLLVGYDKFPFRRSNRQEKPDISIFPRR